MLFVTPAKAGVYVLKRTAFPSPCQSAGTMTMFRVTISPEGDSLAGFSGEVNTGLGIVYDHGITQF